MLLLLFVVIYGSTIFKKTNKIEGFTSAKKDDNDDDDYDKDDDDKDDDDKDDDAEDFSDTIKEKSKDSFKKKIKEDEESSRNDKINSIKSVLFNSVNSLKSTAENEYKKSVAENLQLVYENEKQQNKKTSKNSSGKNSGRNSSKSSGGKSSGKSTSGKEDFKAINIRKFDPSNEEDTNLLITKEILQDIINRIEYNFESNTYLKKYIKHRLEEVVEINKLLDDEED